MKDRFREEITGKLDHNVSPAKRMDYLEVLNAGIDKRHGNAVEEILVNSLVNDDNPVVRHEVAFLLGRLYGIGSIVGKLALSALCKSVLEDVSPLVRHEAAESLAWFQNPEALNALKQLTQDPSPDVVATACIAIEQLQNINPTSG